MAWALALTLVAPAAAPAAAKTLPTASFADLAESLLPAVVNVATTQTVQDRGPSMDMPQFPPGSPFEEFFKDFFERNGGNQPQQIGRAHVRLQSLMRNSYAVFCLKKKNSKIYLHMNNSIIYNT